MRITQIIYTLTIVFFINTCHSQVNFKNLDSNHIYSYSKFHFIINNQYVRPGKLKPFFETNRRSYQEYHKSIICRNIALEFSVPFIGGILLSKTYFQHNDKWRGYFFAAFSIKSLIFSGVFFHKKNKHFAKAISIYNSTH